jgi:hypothetical protein
MKRPVAGYRVSHAVDDREGRGGLDGIAFVAERNVASLRQPARGCPEFRRTSVAAR